MISVREAEKLSLQEIEKFLLAAKQCGSLRLALPANSFVFENPGMANEIPNGNLSREPRWFSVNRLGVRAKQQSYWRAASAGLEPASSRRQKAPSRVD
jgi:hypothetical protein